MHKREKAFEQFVRKIKEIGPITSLDKVTLNTMVDRISVGDRILNDDGQYEQKIDVWYPFENCFST